MHNLDPNPRIVSENSHKDKNLQMIQFLLNRVYNQLSILIIDDTIQTFTTSIFKIFESISESEQQRQIVKALKKKLVVDWFRLPWLKFLMRAGNLPRRVGEINWTPTLHTEQQFNSLTQLIEVQLKVIEWTSMNLGELYTPNFGN